ncbi:MAG: hypothetical protein ACPL7B_08855, partial [Candidatus Poribacteria bacterium]
MIKIKFILSIFLFIFAFLTKISYSETEIQVKTVFNGYHKQGHYLPLRIIVDNQGKNLIGNLSIEIRSKGQTFITPISITNDQRLEKLVYIRPDESEQNIKIRLIDDDKNLILEKETRLNIISEDSRLVAVIDQDGDKLKTEQSQRIYAVNKEIEELPDKWIGYDSIDAVILGSFSPDSISENQKKALIDWLCGGGIIIISGGSDSQNLIGSFIEPFLPVKIKSTKIIRSLPSIRDHFGYELSDIPIIVALSEPFTDSRTIIAENDGLPILTEKNVGAGKVVFLSYNFADPIFNLWQGYNELWSLIFNLKNELAKPKYENVSRFISENGKSAYPSYKIFGIFLFLYLFCVSIVGYIFQKRESGKILLAISLTVIIFAVFAYGFNYIIGKRLSMVIDYSIVNVHKNVERAGIRSFFIPFSPNKSELKLNFNDINTIFIENPASKNDKSSGSWIFLQNDTSQITIRDVKAFRNRLFYSRLYIDFKDNVLIKELNNNQIEVMNNMPFDITDCYLFWGDRYAKIGTITFNNRSKFSLDQKFSGNVFDNYSVDDENRSKFFNLIKSS